MKAEQGSELVRITIQWPQGAGCYIVDMSESVADKVVAAMNKAYKEATDVTRKHEGANSKEAVA